MMDKINQTSCYDPFSIETNPTLLKLITNSGLPYELCSKVFLTKTWFRDDPYSTLTYDENCLSLASIMPELAQFERVVFPKDGIVYLLEFIKKLKKDLKRKIIIHTYLNEKELLDFETSFFDVVKVERIYALMNLPSETSNYQQAHSKIIQKIQNHNSFELIPAAKNLTASKKLIRKIHLMGKDKGFKPLPIKQLDFLCQMQDSLFLAKTSESKDFEALFYLNQKRVHYLYGAPEYRKGTNSLVELLHFAARHFSSLGAQSLNLGRLAYGEDGVGLNFIKKSLANRFVTLFEVQVTI